MANINILYRQISEYFAEDGTRSGPGLEDRRRELRGNADGYNYELGADYEFAWGPGRMKFIGLTRAMHVDFSDELQVFYADDSANSGSRFDRRSKEREHILRTEYRLAQKGVSGSFHQKRHSINSTTVPVYSNCAMANFSQYN